CRCLDAPAAQGPDHGQPVELGQHAIDDQHVVLAVKRMRQPFLAVAGEIRNMTDLAKRLREIIGGIAVIFDDQETHDEPAILSVAGLPCRRLMQRWLDHNTISRTIPEKRYGSTATAPGVVSRKARGAAGLTPPPRPTPSRRGRHMPGRS